MCTSACQKDQVLPDILQGLTSAVQQEFCHIASMVEEVSKRKKTSSSQSILSPSRQCKAPTVNHLEELNLIAHMLLS